MKLKGYKWNHFTRYENNISHAVMETLAEPKLSVTAELQISK